MGKDKKTPIIIDEVEYEFYDMDDDQKQIVNHLIDLDRKIGSAQFNLDQLQVGKQAFLTMLRKSLVKKPDDIEVQ